MVWRKMVTDPSNPTFIDHCESDRDAQARIVAQLASLPGANSEPIAGRLVVEQKRLADLDDFVANCEADGLR